MTTGYLDAAGLQQFAERAKAYIDSRSANTTGATATIHDILVNKTAYANGEKITGVVPFYQDDTSDKMWIGTYKTWTILTLDSRTYTFTGEAYVSNTLYSAFSEAQNHGKRIKKIETYASASGLSVSNYVYGYPYSGGNKITLMSGHGVYSVEVDWSTSCNYRYIYVNNKTDADVLKAGTTTFAKVYNFADVENFIQINSTTLQTQLDTKKHYCNKNIIVKTSDSNFIASNIKKGVAIFGTTGTYTPALQSKTISPTTATQIITPDSNYAGLNKITVNAVTKAIDNNITAENIKNGITILGVTGILTSSAKVINVATAAEMDALLTSANVGNIYRFTGTTDSKYINGDLYEVTNE